MIKIKSLQKHYKMGEQQVSALAGVDVEINKNEFVAIMGSSGSGKSTLMNIIGCLDKPTRGEYFLNGNNVKDLDDDELSSFRNQSVGFVFQSFHLLPRSSALDNVLLPLRFSEPKHTDAEYALQLLDKVGLKSRAHHRPNQLSGGQRQRVAIARALINNPSILLADEPTGALDSKTSVEIMELFTDLHKSGQTIVLVTHEDEVATYAQRVIHMRDGLVKSIELREPNVA